MKLRAVSVPRRTSRFIRGQMLEQFLRLKQNLYRGRHVSRGVWLDNRKEPPLVLHRGRKAKIGAHPVAAANAKIPQSTSAGNEHLTDFLMQEIELHPISRVEPVVRPCLCSLTASAHPTSDYVPIVRIPASPGSISVEVTGG